jgi:hypothetical protein
MQPNSTGAIMATRPSTLLLGIALGALSLPAASASEEYADQFNYGQASGKGQDWVQAIRVTAPAYRSQVSGTVNIVFSAPGMDKAEARCWHQPDAAHPDPWGYDAVVMPAQPITGKQEVSFAFPADEFPNGPTTIRLATRNDAGKQDLCELQLFNTGGVMWNQGIPDAMPPAAKGLKLIFADDFAAMPSISRYGVGTTYQGHKPPNGSQDFSGWRFSQKDDYPGAHDPYEQVGSWLRIKARAEGPDKKTWGTGIFAPVDINYNGVTAAPPFYMECRMTAQSAPGAWSAFWTLTIPNPDIPGCDELDIIEGYGGVGPGNPNDNVGYHCVSHFWAQDAYNKDVKAKGYKTHTRPPMMELAGKSYWSTTFHTYGVYVDATDTVYYFDNVEVLRHPSGPVSAVTPAYFLVNYAIGGISGWKIDMKRYGDASDMWVDFVRVYSGTLPKPSISPLAGYLLGGPATVTIATPTPQATLHYTLDGSVPTATSPVATGPLSIAKPCTIKAIAMADGAKASAVSVAEIKAALAAQPPAGATRPGLACDYYEGDWKLLPDFTTLTATSSVVTPTIGFPEQHAADHFALRHSGYIAVPADGLYTFFTTSDDGSQLLIDGQLIVDNDGPHGAVERSGTVGLIAGTHRIEVRYFEVNGGDSLEAAWQGPRLAKAPIPAGVLSSDAPKP